MVVERAGRWRLRSGAGRGWGAWWRGNVVERAGWWRCSVVEQAGWWRGGVVERAGWWRGGGAGRVVVVWRGGARETGVRWLSQRNSCTLRSHTRTFIAFSFDLSLPPPSPPRKKSQISASFPAGLSGSPSARAGRRGDRRPSANPPPKSVTGAFNL